MLTDVRAMWWSEASLSYNKTWFYGCDSLELLMPLVVQLVLPELHVVCFWVMYPQKRHTYSQGLRQSLVLLIRNGTQPVDSRSKEALPSQST